MDSTKETSVYISINIFLQDTVKFRSQVFSFNEREEITKIIVTIITD